MANASGWSLKTGSVRTEARLAFKKTPVGSASASRDWLSVVGPLSALMVKDNLRQKATVSG